MGLRIVSRNPTKYGGNHKRPPVCSPAGPIARFVLGKLDEVLDGAPRGGLLEVPDREGAADALRARDPAPDDATDLSSLQAQQLEDLVRGDLTLQSALTQASAVPAADSLLSTSFREQVDAEAPEVGDRAIVSWTLLARAAVRIARRTLGRIAIRRDHGPYVTLVEEVLRELFLDHAIGSVWSAMKKDTADAFAPGAGGTAIIDGVLQWWRPGRTLTLVGHSAGSVFVLECLDALAHRDARLQVDVVWMAAAATFARWERSWPAWERYVRRFLAVGLSDARERRDQMLSFAYPASLLYFVSGLAEQQADEPIVGMERHWRGGGPAVERAKGWLAAGAREVAWANDGSPWCEATDHGGVPDDPVTRAAVATFLRPQP